MKTTTMFYQRALLAFTVGMFLSCAARVAQAQELDRTKRPPSGAPTTLRVPAIQMRTLKNGIKVAVLEQHELPVVSVRVVIDAQALLDPPGKEGVATLTSQMLAEGTTTRTADQLAEAFADLGNTVRPDGFSTVTANVDSSLVLLADMLLHPAFPQASLDRIRQNSLAALKRSKDQPTYLARRVFVNAVWGAGHPYERASTEQSLGAITRDDLVAFHGRYYRPQNVKVVVAGDITPAQAVAKIDKVLGKWPAGGFKSRYVIPPAKPMALGTVYLYDRPNSPQSVFVVGSTGPARNTPDFYAIDLMNTSLGGAFSSRLNLNLRETHSFTYGASSIFSYDARGARLREVERNQVITAEFRNRRPDRRRRRTGAPRGTATQLLQHAQRALSGCDDRTGERGGEEVHRPGKAGDRHRWRPEADRVRTARSEHRSRRRRRRERQTDDGGKR